MPRLTAIVFRFFAVRRGTKNAHAMPTLALARLANAPGQASIAMGSVLSSFTLIVAMAIMVVNFRVSVVDWLEHLLSADVYARIAAKRRHGRLEAGSAGASL